MSRDDKGRSWTVLYSLHPKFPIPKYFPYFIQKMSIDWIPKKDS